MSQLLRNAIILDTETLGLERGAGMHELAIMDVQAQHVRSFVLDPNAVTVQTMPQEHTGLAGTAGDKYTAHKYGSWMEALRTQVRAAAGHAVPDGQTMELLREQQPWLHSMIKHYPHLLGAEASVVEQVNTGRTKLLESLGVSSSLGTRVSVQDALGTLQQAMSGKTVWIANAAFESKQIGAQLGAAGQIAVEDFKSGLETWNPQSPDPFYVTGSEVTKARVLAQQTGDWTGVWKAYNAHGPAAGETAVRDIQDVTRALHSYGAKLGFTDKDYNYLGTGIDISHKMHAYAAQDLQRQNMPEFHRAAEDAAIHEQYVLRRNVQMVSALEQVAEGTQAGRAHLQAGGTGVLGQVARYFESLEAHAPTLMKEQALKRLQRAQQDLLKQGFTTQRQGGMPYVQDQLNPRGEFASAWRLQSTRTSYQTMDQVLGHLETEGRYSDHGVDLRAMYQDMKPYAADEVKLNRYVHEQVQGLRSVAVQPGVENARLDAVLRRPRSSAAVEAAELLGRAGAGKAGLALGAAAALSLVGAGVGSFQQPRPRGESILSYGYDEWVEQQRIEGLSEGTVATAGRHVRTDFGSPYQGPVGVQQVFLDQKLLEERERWLRIQYGARHYESKIPGLPTWNPRVGSGYDFVKSGQAVRGEDYGMRGNLQKININDGNWRITAEDADTVTIRRGGLVGGLQSFFGLNKSYSFRLAGLDSTEVAHADRPAQPFANQATQAFRAMLNSGQNLEVVFDPNQITYGRALGAVIADGKNLNYELVKRGLASHLPYGKASDSIINYRTLEAAESRAYQTNRGMWSQPWSRSFYEHSAASGNRVTFNTLAKTESVVKNSGTMMMVAAMDAAQASGTFTNAQAGLAAQLGSRYNVGADKVGPWSMSAASTPSTSYLQEQLQDLAGFIRTKGRNQNSNKLSHRGGYGALDNKMALDTAGASTSVETKRRLSSFAQYRSSRALSRQRKARMAFHQRKTLQAMHSSSPVQHHRM